MRAWTNDVPCNARSVCDLKAYVHEHVRSVRGARCGGCWGLMLAEVDVVVSVSGAGTMWSHQPEAGGGVPNGASEVDAPRAEGPDQLQLQMVGWF